MIKALDGLGDKEEMSIIKCPRCEINFIKEEDGYCSICLKEMSGEAPKEEGPLTCIECGERPVIAGEELCLECLKAHQLVIDMPPTEETDDDDDKLIEKEKDDDDELLEEDLSVDDALEVVIPDSELLEDADWLDLEDEAEDEVDEFDGFYEENVYDMDLSKEK